MEPEIMQNPYNGLPLRWTNAKGNNGLTDDSGSFFPFRKDYPNFLADQQLTGLNRKFQQIYDRASAFANLGERFFSKAFDYAKTRKNWLQGITVNPGDRVLEVSVGAGWNIRHLPRHARYFGMDISAGMLDHCVKNARRWGIDLQLCQANAEYLPYCDNSFDTVFHVGGINFFNDRCRAIREMVRVAKPGARIVIIDQTARDIKKQYRKIPIMRRCYSDKEVDRSRLYAPAACVPEEIRDLEVKLIDDGSMYQLSFVKPIKDMHAMYLLSNG